MKRKIIETWRMLASRPRLGKEWEQVPPAKGFSGRNLYFNNGGKVTRNHSHKIKFQYQKPVFIKIHILNTKYIIIKWTVTSFRNLQQIWQSKVFLNWMTASLVFIISFSYFCIFETVHKKLKPKNLITTD